MTWEILWALILGFALSGAVQAVVSKAEMTRLLPDDSRRSLTRATLLGAASSSCSYAAVALARSIFRKGADFTSAMAFQFASTNLVIELGIILAVLMGWEFTAAEFFGGVVMIVLLALLFRATLAPKMIEMARRQAERGVAGRMEGHAAMDMSVTGGSVLSRVTSPRGYTAISHFFVMDWASIWIDVFGGLLIAGALAAWVPESFWQSFFLVDHPFWASVWGPLVGPLVAMLSFVCSIGNVPLAAVLWNGGISFGGVAAFIFADLIILPILNIYRKYYGRRMATYLLVTFYLTMAAAGLRGRDRLRPARAHPGGPQRERDRGEHPPQLHDGPERALPAARRRADRALPAHRRPGDAAHDGRRPVVGPRAPRPSADAADAAPQTMRRSVAQRVSWCRFDSCSLRSTDETCVSTVFTDRCSSPAISRYV